MKIAGATDSPIPPAGLRSRVASFKDILAALQQLPRIVKREPGRDGHFLAVEPRPVADNQIQNQEARVAAAPQVGAVETGVEEVASRVGQAAQQAVSPERVVVSFNSGWLTGVTCVVQVQGQAVRCRFKSLGAVSRKVVGAAKVKVAGRLKASGFELEGYEVGR